MFEKSDIVFRRTTASLFFLNKVPFLPSRYQAKPVRPCINLFSLIWIRCYMRRERRFQQLHCCLAKRAKITVESSSPARQTEGHECTLHASVTLKNLVLHHTFMPAYNRILLTHSSLYPSITNSLRNYRRIRSPNTLIFLQNLIFLFKYLEYDLFKFRLTFFKRGLNF